MAVQLESAARLAALRDKADAVTGESSATLAGAVDALIAGFGSGGGGSGDGGYIEVIARTISGDFNNDSITEVGRYGFYNCAELTSVKLSKLVSIADYGFSSCSKLINVEMPVLKSTAGNAFREDKSLTSVKFPSLTTLDGKFNFYGCTALRMVDLPVLESIGHEKQFMTCPAFVALILRGGNIPSIWVNALVASNIEGGTAYIYVPAALVDSYKAATNWATYATQFRALEDYTVDGTITGELDESKI